MSDDEPKRYKTIDRKVIGFPLDRSNYGEMVKPGELIDIKEISPLTLTDQRIYNLLIANAWERITEPVEHVIDKTDLCGTHNGNERIEDSIRRLMSAIAEGKSFETAKPPSSVFSSWAATSSRKASGAASTTPFPSNSSKSSRRARSLDA